MRRKIGPTKKPGYRKKRFSLRLVGFSSCSKPSAWVWKPVENNALCVFQQNGVGLPAAQAEQKTSPPAKQREGWPERQIQIGLQRPEVDFRDTWMNMCVSANTFPQMRCPAEINQRVLFQASERVTHHLSGETESCRYRALRVGNSSARVERRSSCLREGCVKVSVQWLMRRHPSRPVKKTNPISTDQYICFPKYGSYVLKKRYHVFIYAYNIYIYIDRGKTGLFMSVNLKRTMLRTTARCVKAGRQC